MAEPAARRCHQPIGMRRRHFYEISEHRIVLDLKRSNRRLAAIARFESGNDAPRLIAQAACLFERGMRT